MLLCCLRDIVYLLCKMNVEISHRPKVRTNGSVLYLVPGAVLPRFPRRTSRGCLLGNQTRDFVADFFTGILRPSELGTTTNKKPRPLGLGFLSSSGGRTRTYDLRVMSPTSYQLLHPAILDCKDTEK